MLAMIRQYIRSYPWRGGSTVYDNDSLGMTASKWRSRCISSERKPGIKMTRGKLFVVGSTLMLGMLHADCAADPLANTTRYEITIPADDHRVALVTASLVPTDGEFHMFPGANQLPKRWATFVSDFEVRDENDNMVPVSARDDGTWQLSSLPPGRVSVRYRIRLDHEDHAWSGGVDGAAYWRESVSYTHLTLPTKCR